MENEAENILLIEEEMSPVDMQEECGKIKPFLQEFVECYVANKDKPVEDWLNEKMKESLPDKTDDEIRSMTEEIVSAINMDEENKESLQKSVESGRSKESWFASKVQEAVSAMSAQQSAEYLTGLDRALKTANESLYGTITTQAGAISQNPRLDGFIAEQYHAQTFNMNAEATGSAYRAKVLEPTGNGYAKNSVDLVIVDADGRVVKRYQSKYCKDPKATERAFEQGDYRGQQKLVPDGQEGEIQKKATAVLEAPDGTTSNPLTKSRAEQMRDEAQSGNWNDFNWNEYKVKDLAMGIGKQAGIAALEGAAIGAGFDIAQKLWQGEEIDGAEVVETALVSGADFGVKAAVAGALKVGAEKGVISVIPKGTPAGTIANIAFIAVEDAKIMKQVALGELSCEEGIEKIQLVTVSTAAGLLAMGQGTLIGGEVGAFAGAMIGINFGPAAMLAGMSIGRVVGSFVGASIGYMAGSKTGEMIVNGARKVRDGAIRMAKQVKEKVKEAVGNGLRKMITW